MIYLVFSIIMLPAGRDGWIGLYMRGKDGCVVCVREGGVEGLYVCMFEGGMEGLYVCIFEGWGGGVVCVYV